MVFAGRREAVGRHIGDANVVTVLVADYHDVIQQYTPSAADVADDAEVEEGLVTLKGAQADFFLDPVGAGPVAARALIGLQNAPAAGGNLLAAVEIVSSAHLQPVTIGQIILDREREHRLERGAQVDTDVGDVGAVDIAHAAVRRDHAVVGTAVVGVAAGTEVAPGPLARLGRAKCRVVGDIYVEELVASLRGAVELGVGVVLGIDIIVEEGVENTEHHLHRVVPREEVLARRHQRFHLYVVGVGGGRREVDEKLLLVLVALGVDVAVG